MYVCLSICLSVSLAYFLFCLLADWFDFVLRVVSWTIPLVKADLILYSIGAQAGRPTPRSVHPMLFEKGQSEKISEIGGNASFNWRSRDGRPWSMGVDFGGQPGHVPPNNWGTPMHLSLFTTFCPSPIFWFAHPIFWQVYASALVYIPYDLAFVWHLG